MSEECQELAVYKILMDLVEGAAYELKERSHDESVPLKDLGEVTRLYCMLKDGLRDDIKADVWEKMHSKGLTRQF